MTITAGAKVNSTTLKVKNSSWWGYGMPRPLCWIWHKTNWMLTGNAGYSQCWRCGKCHRTWGDDLWPESKLQSNGNDRQREGFYV
jgi:hypothetical protein